MREEKKRKRESQKLSKRGVVKLVGSWKLESGVDKRDVREEKKKKECGIVIILTFEFEQNRLLF